MPCIERARVTDHYRLLQVRRDASAEVISAAYRRLMRDAHPDRGGDAERARRLNVAYETLSDSAARRAYDHSLGQSTDDGGPSRVEAIAARLGAGLGTQYVRLRRVLREVRKDLST